MLPSKIDQVKVSLERQEVIIYSTNVPWWLSTLGHVLRRQHFKFSDTVTVLT